MKSGGETMKQLCEFYLLCVILAYSIIGVDGRSLMIITLILVPSAFVIWKLKRLWSDHMRP